MLWRGLHTAKTSLECSRRNVTSGASSCFCTTPNWIGIRRIIFRAGVRGIARGARIPGIGMRTSILWTDNLRSCSRTTEKLRYASQFRSEEHTSELQSHLNLVCRLLLEKKKK